MTYVLKKRVERFLASQIFIYHNLNFISSQGTRHIELSLKTIKLYMEIITVFKGNLKRPKHYFYIPIVSLLLLNMEKQTGRTINRINEDLIFFVVIMVIEKMYM
ncbi:hypothetical protein [Caldiplasma sukawensis]